MYCDVDDIEEYVHDTLSAYVTDESAYDRGDYDDLEEVITKAGPALKLFRTGLGLLVLGRASEASDWFEQSIPGFLWKFSAHTEDMGSDAEVPKEPYKVSWEDLRKAMYATVLCGDDAVVADTVTEVSDRLSNPAIRRYEDAPGFRHARVAALYEVLADKDPTDFFEQFEAALPEAGNQYQTPRYEGELTALRGIDERDSQAVEDGVTQMIDIHDQYIEDNVESLYYPPEDVHLTGLCVNRHATALVVLARRQGLAVRPNSEYVPEAVFGLE